MEQAPKPNPRDNLAAKALRLADLISYQEGAVVSRTLASQPGGTVTLFAFDEGQGLSEHTAPYDGLVYMMEGEADITVAGQMVRARAGDLVIMRANQPHALDARGRFKMLLTMLRS